MQALAFVDLETTGATASADRITEIGIVEVDAAGVREWSTLVNPGTAIPGFIQAMTGITDDMVREAPTFEDVADEVLERLRGRLFIAHNARFDYGFLKSEFRRAGVDFRSTVLCTVKLSRKLFPEHRKHGLDALIERHGLRANGRHRALADAQLIHQFWNQVSQTQPQDGFAALLQQMTAPPSLPAQLDPGIIEELPEEPGVYLFYGEKELLLYVGRARDIRKRALAHFAGDQASASKRSLAQQIRRIEWICTGGEIGALLREAALIREWQPMHNRHVKHDDELCAIALVDHGAGVVKPAIMFECDLDLGRQNNLYGLFRNAREANQVLLQIADAHALCHALLGLEQIEAGTPCGAQQSGKCRGACIGEEAPAAHALRLVAALSKQKLKAWPFAGPACIREGDEVLVVDHWRYLGSAQAEEELWPLLEQARAPFDRETYRILSKVSDRMTPLAR